MTSAPGSWSPGLQGLNARGALKVHLGCPDRVEAGQKARSAARPTRLTHQIHRSHIDALRRQ